MPNHLKSTHFKPKITAINNNDNSTSDKIELYTVVFPFGAIEDSHLNLDPGDVIRVLERADNGWWRGVKVDKHKKDEEEDEKGNGEKMKDCKEDENQEGKFMEGNIKNAEETATDGTRESNKSIDKNDETETNSEEELTSAVALVGWFPSGFVTPYEKEKLEGNHSKPNSKKFEKNEKNGSPSDEESSKDGHPLETNEQSNKPRVSSFLIRKLQNERTLK